MTQDVEALRQRFLDAWRAYSDAAGLPNLAGPGRFPGEPLSVPLPEVMALASTLLQVREHLAALGTLTRETDPHGSADAAMGLVDHIVNRLRSWGKA